MLVKNFNGILDKHFDYEIDREIRIIKVEFEDGISRHYMVVLQPDRIVGSPQAKFYASHPLTDKWWTFVTSYGVTYYGSAVQPVYGQCARRAVESGVHHIGDLLGVKVLGWEIASSQK